MPVRILGIVLEQIAMTGFELLDKEYVFSNTRIRKSPKLKLICPKILSRPRQDFVTNTGLRISLLNPNDSVLERFPYFSLSKRKHRERRRWLELSSGFAFFVRPQTAQLAGRMIAGDISNFTQSGVGWKREQTGEFSVHKDNTFVLSADEGIAILNMIVITARAFEVGEI